MRVTEFFFTWFFLTNAYRCHFLWRPATLCTHIHSQQYIVQAIFSLLLHYIYYNAERKRHRNHEKVHRKNSASDYRSAPSLICLRAYTHMKFSNVPRQTNWFSRWLVHTFPPPIIQLEQFLCRYSRTTAALISGRLLYSEKICSLEFSCKMVTKMVMRENCTKFLLAKYITLLKKIDSSSDLLRFQQTETFLLIVLFFQQISAEQKNSRKLQTVEVCLGSIPSRYRMVLLYYYYYLSFADFLLLADEIQQM